MKGIEKDGLASLQLSSEHLPETDYIGITDLLEPNQVLDLAEMVSGMHLTDLEQLIVAGCRVGKTTTIDLSLTLKAQFKDAADPNVLEFIRLTTLNSLIAIEAMHRLTQAGRLRAGQTTICQNSVYSQNITISDYANSRNIRQYFMEPSAYTVDSVKTYRSQVEDQVNRRLLMSSPFEHAAPEAYFAFCRAYLAIRITGGVSHAYSPVTGIYKNRHLREVFPESEGRSCFAYFSNSPDELCSIEASADVFGIQHVLPNNKQPFATETDNIRAIISHAASSSQSLYFIRLHPRLGRDRRGLGQSFSRDEVVNAISDMRPPKNVIVIYPEEDIPSYWLGCWCRGILSYRGTMPLEMNLIGYSPLIGSAENMTINSSINSHAVVSRKTSQAWLEACKELGSLEQCSAMQLYSFARDFYYSRALSLLDLSDTPDRESLTMREARIFLDGNSVCQPKHCLPSTCEERKKHLYRYTLWVQRFVFENLVAFHEAPVFEVISKILNDF